MVRLVKLSALAFAVGIAGMIAYSASEGCQASAQEIQFRYAIDNSPLEVKAKPNEKVTEAVTEFKKSGKNPYSGKSEVIAEGKKLYGEFCQACHLPDGAGGMGASLIGEKHIYPRVSTDVGLFEVVYGGASGAMQPFSERMSQDEILKVMAYLRTIMKQ
jgi:cytochrome c-L